MRGDSGVGGSRGLSLPGCHFEGVVVVLVVIQWGGRVERFFYLASERSAQVSSGPHSRARAAFLVAGEEGAMEAVPSLHVQLPLSQREVRALPFFQRILAQQRREKSTMTK